MIDFADFRAARERIAPHIRRTPLLQVGPALQSAGLPGGLLLKLESLQVSGSFKARGATNKVLSLAPDERARGLVTASGGNHGLGVAYAGWLARVPATIYLPSNAPPVKAERLMRWCAEVVWKGEVWDDADAAARAAAAAQGKNYVHAFADPTIVAGQGTISLEILEDDPGVDVLLVAIGGGGLISGVAAAAKHLRPDIRVIGVEPTGAPTLYESLRAGEVIELPSVHSAANTLAPRRSAALNLEIIQQTVEQIVLVTDEQMRDAARWLWFEMGLGAELAGAAAVAALLSGAFRPEPGERVCALVCGVGTDGVG
jgi:threonine dehydratase